MPGTLIFSGLGVSTVGLVACANCLYRAADGLLPAAAVAVLGGGAVLALVGLQFSVKAPSLPGSAARLVAGSVSRSVFVMALIVAGIALSFGLRFAFDMARFVGQAFPVVVAIDLVTYLSALQARLVRTTQ